jgi:hypothetical protein
MTIRQQGDNLPARKSIPVDVRSDRHTADNELVLVFSIDPLVKNSRFDYRWIDKETGETISGKYQSESAATYWQEGYELSRKILLSG